MSNNTDIAQWLLDVKEKIINMEDTMQHTHNLNNLVERIQTAAKATIGPPNYNNSVSITKPPYTAPANGWIFATETAVKINGYTIGSNGNYTSMYQVLKGDIINCKGTFFYTN